MIGPLCDNPPHDDYRLKDNDHHQAAVGESHVIVQSQGFTDGLQKYDARKEQKQAEYDAQ
ncbi:MAG: hypothetical protein ACLFWB_00310 [Armatimonadota bacterium]